MPIIINEIVIKTNVEKQNSSKKPSQSCAGVCDKLAIDAIVKQAVDKILEILSERKQR